jgi:dTDP-4-dehydrorhamnose 3,5-epimerase
MEFVPLEIDGTYGIKEIIKSDIRGDLIRVWDKNSLLLDFHLIQSSIVINPILGTLRGLHYQLEPYSENKIIQCLTGMVFDVIVDLRESSKTYGRFLGLNIGPTSEYLGLLAPAGCAHGYLTMKPNSTLIYFMDKEFSDKHARGIIWNDPNLTIPWPIEPKLISDRDNLWPNFITH